MTIERNGARALLVLGGMIAWLLAGQSLAQQGQLYSDFLATPATPEIVVMADGGAYFVSLNRFDASEDVLRFWRISGEDAVLVDSLELDSMSAYTPQFAVHPDGSSVLIQHRVQRGLRGRDERTELELWQPGKRNSLRSVYANEEEVPCGIAFLGTTGELAECAFSINDLNYHRFSRTRLDNRSRREHLQSWGTGLSGGRITVHDFRADEQNQVQVLVKANFLTLNDCPTCTELKPVVLRSEPGSEKLQHIQPHAFQEVPSIDASFGFGSDTGSLVERRASTFVYHTNCLTTCSNQVTDGTEPAALTKLMLAGSNGLHFERHANGLSAFLFGERNTVMVANLLDSGVLAFALNEGRDEAVLVSTTGIKRVSASTERIRAAGEYSQGIAMLQSGFGALGMNRIITAFELDPTYVQRNQAHPYLHALPLLFEALPATVQPADTGRLFLKLYQTALSQNDGIIAIRSLFNHGLYALKAGQPAISRQAALALGNFVSTSTLLSDESRALFTVWPDMLEALVLLEEGQDDAAYDLLAERGGLVREDYSEAAVVAEFFPQLRPFYKNRAKFAFLLNETDAQLAGFSPVSNLPDVPRDYPDVNGQIIAAVVGTQSVVAPVIPEDSTAVNEPRAGQVLD